MLACGTVPSRDSAICRPSSVLCLSLPPVIERLRMFLPSIVSAAYDDPPSATKTAIVDITFAYVTRVRSFLSIRRIYPSLPLTTTVSLGEAPSPNG